MFLFGAALVWSIHLAYGSRAGKSDDTLKLCLLTAGWLLILVGLSAFIVSFASGPLMILVPLFWIVVLATLHRYRQSERQALVWTLAFAAQRGIPLANAARAFAQERTDELGSRSWRLAELLDAGLPLSSALHASANWVPLNVLVAARMGTQNGTLPTALMRAAEENREVERALRTMLERIIFLLMALMTFFAILTFLMLKIIPTFEKMFKEFELDLPAPTILIIALSQTFARHWYLFAPLGPLFTGAFFIGLLHYVGWLSWRVPGVGWLRVRYDRTVMLQNLALAVGNQQPLTAALASLEAAFPTYTMRSRLRRALRKCQQGVDTFTALRKARLITRYEQAVLSAAQRVGNLPWALEVMAETALRRLTLRLQRWSTFLFAVLFILLSLFILLFAVGMLQPLSDLILNLSHA